MQTRSAGNEGLLPLDPEIDRTVRRARRMANNPAAQRVPLQNHFVPGNEEHDTIQIPAIEANNFNLSPALVQMVGSDPFRGGPTEDPNVHIVKFSRLCGTIKQNGVNAEVIKLTLFPFSLHDAAQRWLSTYPDNHFTTWEQLRGEFLKKFFPPAKTQKLRRDIQQFKQQTNESLANAWERFNDLVRQCPHHEFPDWFLMTTFYDGLNRTDRNMVDASAGGSFTALDYEGSKDLVEKITSNGSNWHAEGSTSKAGIHEVDHFTALSAKMDSITTMINRMAKVTLNSQMANFADSNSQVPAVQCGVCNGNHEWGECITNPQPNTEQVNQVGYNRNQNWQGGFNQNRNHPGFSWSNPNGAANPQQQFQRKQQSEQVNSDPNSLILQQVLQKLQSMDEEMAQMRAHQKMLEKTIANQPPTSTINATGRLPAQPENPRGQMNAVTTRSGKRLADPPIPASRGTEATSENLEKEDLNSSAAARRDEPLLLKPNADTGASRRDEPEFRRDESGTQQKSGKKNGMNQKVNNSNAVPFPDRIVNKTEEQRRNRFFKLIEKLEVTIPLLTILFDMPSYAKYLKEIFSKKRNLEPKEPVTMECSALLQSKLPPKLGDPGSFTIPCVIGESIVPRALCDLGASVSLIPYSLCKKLHLGEPKPTSMTLQLADRSFKSPLGILEDIPVKIDKFYIPCDFVVMDIEEDANIPIILGRPFLATAGATIDVKNGTLVFEIGEEKIKFDIGDMADQSSSDYVCYALDAIDEIDACVHEFQEEGNFAYFQNLADTRSEYQTSFDYWSNNPGEDPG